MSHGRRLALLGFVPLLIFLLGLILFSEVLLPFLVGMAAEVDFLEDLLNESRNVQHNLAVGF